MSDDTDPAAQDGLDESETARWAPADLWDGRAPMDWRSRYTDPGVRRSIAAEAIYCALLFCAAPILMLALWTFRPDLPYLTDSQAHIFCKYAFAWLGGLFGGVLFDIKWLYHGVAKGMWHEDRRLWRLFMPHLSAGLAFAVVLAMSSGMFVIFDQEALLTPAVAATIGFLVGYFSDHAIAKLSEIAGTLFGTGEAHGRKAKQ